MMMMHSSFGLHSKKGFGWMECEGTETADIRRMRIRFRAAIRKCLRVQLALGNSKNYTMAYDRSHLIL